MRLVGVSHKRHKNYITAGYVHKNTVSVTTELRRRASLFLIFLNSRCFSTAIHLGNGTQNHRFRQSRPRLTEAALV